MKELAKLFRIMASRQWLWLIAGILAGTLVLAANVALMAVSGWFIASMAVAGATKVSFNYALPAVAIRGGTRGGRVVISYRSHADFDRIFAALLNPAGDASQI